MENGNLNELSRATGNDCGGISVDGRFFQLLIKILGGPLMKALKDEDPSAYIDLFREFETVKRTISSSLSGKVNFTIPYAALDELCQRFMNDDLSSVIRSSTFSKEITLRGDKMRVDIDLIKNLFKPTIDSIIFLMRNVLSENRTKKVTQILLVGGFAECHLLRDAVCSAFPDKRIIIPDEAGLAVLKGAVLFGHKPKFIETRIIRFSYGIRKREKFDPEQHSRNHFVKIAGKKFCEDIFDKLVEIDQVVKNEEVFKRTYTTSHPFQDGMTFDMYISTDRNPSYTDDDSCSLLGSAVIQFPNTSSELI